ncbi:MAG TPA: amino acid adenylation domain-containing protein, partial [Ktedonobacteraceae bacterium]|nr:amino acid adenylation domain-containing protein [Ktedonobacteraceae bacterium]
MSDQLLKRIAHLSPERREQLLRRLNAGLEPQQARQPALPLRQPGEPCLLSFAQQRLWFLDQLDEQSSEYTVCRAIHLTGGLDEKILERSLYILVARHEILRTTFSVPEGAHEPAQVITSTPPSLLQIQDLTALPASQRLPQAQAIARAEALRPFDLAHGPLARFLLLHLETEEHLLVLCLHHILADGWSLALALRELSLLYTHLLSQPAAETSSPLPPLALQFADYAAWQRHTLQGEHLNELLSYWQHHLQGAPFELALPTDHPRPLQLSHQGRVLTHQPSAPFSHQLTLLARREDVTPFMLLLTVFSILLGRLSGQHDLLIGTPVANRNREEIEALIGCVANTLVVRVRLGECRSFQEVLRQVRESTLQAYAHQDLPFEKVVEALQPQRDLRRTPLFQVMFVFQNTPTSSLALPGIEARMEIIDVESAPFELTCSIEEREAGLEVGIQYNRELFDASTIQRWLRCYEALLNQCLENPDIPLSSLSLLPMGELQHFTNLWERTHPTRDLCLHTLFTEQASQRPDALAVISETTTLTYRELELRANRLAHQLIALGVKAETLVGIYIERSPEMLVGLLAILKAGGAYVPLDPAYPVERLRFMLEDAQPAVILTMEHLRSHLPLSGLATPCICLDTQSDAVSSLDAPPHIALSTQNIAYVIYTSGSTGIPKGVCITHEASVQFCQNIAEHYAFVPEEHVLQFASLSFDLALEEIFAPLSKGATLVLWPQQTTLDLIELTRFMDREQIAVANLSSSLWNAWLDMLIQQELQPPSSLRLMITGNEPIETGRLHLWQQHVGDRIRWLHAYGVTEATVTSTLYSPDLPGLEGAVPIGLPVYNTRIFVLDPHLQPVLPGMPGELYIGGTALARGYLHHPEITAERFVPDPFGSTPGSLLYRTGDLVCYREDGLLRYVGRSDQQVKIHGFRIEVAEVEQALKQHPSLKEVAVIAHGEPTGEKALVAYFVFQDRQTVPTQRLRDFLREHLPAFMLPATFVQLEAFPLLPNGKLDRQRLPELADGLVEEESNMFAPRTPLEDLVLGIWKDLLHLEHIPITANFFELGGYSLLAAQVTSRLRRALQRDVPVRLLFENPTIAHLAARLEQLLQEASVEMLLPILPVERDSSLPPSFEQLRLWFLDQLEPASALYNLPTCIHLTGGLEEEVLERSLHMLVSRHEILRTTFSVPEGAHEPVQVIVSPPPSLLQIQDLTALPASQRLLQAQAIARAEALRPFDLAHGPLARFLLLRLETDEHLLVLCLHHILADGWSLALALRELSLLYTHLLSQPAAETPS